MSGQLALAVCRGSQAELGDLSALMEWLGQEAREGRIRLCGSDEALAPISDEDLNTADSRLSGVRDWCFAVIADI